MEKLKPCPFCGGTPQLLNSIYCARDGANDDIGIIWSIRCTNCGIEKESPLTRYYITQEGTLAIKTGKKDGRTEVINKWNERILSGEYYERQNTKSEGIELCSKNENGEAFESGAHSR